MPGSPTAPDDGDCGCPALTVDSSDHGGLREHRYDPDTRLTSPTTTTPRRTVDRQRQSVLVAPIIGALSAVGSQGESVSLDRTHERTLLLTSPEVRGSLESDFVRDASRGPTGHLGLGLRPRRNLTRPVVLTHLRLRAPRAVEAPTARDREHAPTSRKLYMRCCQCRR